MDRSAPFLLLAISFLPLSVHAESGIAVPPSAPDAPRAEIPLSVQPPEVGIPFGCGMSFPVSQVHNVGSHTGNDAWAWDFRMPEGTPVVAALDGVVRLARGDSDEGGCDPAMARKANYVVIESPGNIETQYLHFSAVSVTPGQHVQRGDLLGYSGKTGWACGAHLHFKVATPVSAGWNNPSVEARFQGCGDPTLETWVSSPPCGGAPEIATQQPAPFPTEHTVPPPGEVQPAALSAAASAVPPSLGVGGPALEARPTPGGPAPGPAVAKPPAPPVGHPLSARGSPLTPSTPPAPAAGPLGPGLQAASSTPPSAVGPPPLSAPAETAGPRDTEAELLDGTDVVAPHR